MNQLSYNDAFETISSTPAMRWLERAEVREGRRLDVRRIASALLCVDGIDPTLVTFAKYRTAVHWDLAEETVDIMVAVRLLEKTASLMADLQWLGPIAAETPELAVAA